MKQDERTVEYWRAFAEELKGPLGTLRTTGIFSSGGCVSGN